MPEGVEKVIVRCRAPGLDLPTSVKSLVVASGASLDVVPPVDTLVLQGTFGTLSPDIQNLEIENDAVVPREVLERMTGLRSLFCLKKTWFPPWLDEIYASDIDTEALAATTNLRILEEESILGLTIPETVRDLRIRAYQGGRFPDFIESLTFYEIEARLEAFPSRLRCLRLLSGIPKDLPEIPETVTEMSFCTADFTGFTIPDQVEILELSSVRNLKKYPAALKHLHLRRIVDRLPEAPDGVVVHYH